MNLKVIEGKGFFFKLYIRMRMLANVLFFCFCRNAPFGTNLEVIKKEERSFFLNFTYKNVINVLFFYFFVGMGIIG